MSSRDKWHEKVLQSKDVETGVGVAVRGASLTAGPLQASWRSIWIQTWIKWGTSDGRVSGKVNRKYFNILSLAKWTENILDKQITQAWLTWRTVRKHVIWTKLAKRKQKEVSLKNQAGTRSSRSSRSGHNFGFYYELNWKVMWTPYFK